ncbi:MAG: fibronectin type III domain-containing protein [Proteobacteria bacterium]|nr:fibronectin type III domain-containing protein [Pseudomonadota bacterium]
MPQMTCDLRPTGKPLRLAAAALGFLFLVGCERVTPESAAGGTATLEWTPPEAGAARTASAAIAGYKVFYGPSQRALYSIVVVPDPQARRYVIHDLAPGTWYFAVAAYTRDNVQGARSNIAVKTVK